MNTEDKITINGEEFTKSSSIEKFNQNEFMIADPCNVMAIVPIKRHTEIKDKLEISGFGDFTKFEGKLKLGELNKNLKSESFYLGESKYSFEYLDKAMKTAKAFLGSKQVEFYLWTENDNQIKNKPCLIVLDNLVFALAPRVDQEDQ